MCDVDELGFLREFRNGLCSRIPHADLKTRRECCYHFRDRTFVRYKRFHSFGDGLATVREVALLPRGTLDDRSRTHAAIFFEFFAAFLHDGAWCLVGSCKYIAKHNGRGSSGEGFCDVARSTYAAVSDN